LAQVSVARQQQCRAVQAAGHVHVTVPASHTVHDTVYAHMTLASFVCDRIWM
jgi:hypothetical protein